MRTFTTIRRTAGSALAITTLASAMALGTVGPVFAHGIGKDSTACWDGYVPGTGVETNRLGASVAGFGGAVGAQGGTHQEWEHIAYSDFCAEVTTPAVNLPFIGEQGGKILGIYESIRVMNANDPCGPGVQVIVKNDSDAQLQFREINTCGG